MSEIISALEDLRAEYLTLMREHRTLRYLVRKYVVMGAFALGLFISWYIMIPLGLSCHLLLPCAY